MNINSNLQNFISSIDTLQFPKQENSRCNLFLTTSKQRNKQEIRLNFICTYNSRRSHFAQIWAQEMAFHSGFEKVFCYPGGTEATALLPTVAETILDTGFEVQTLSKGNNPVYSIKFSGNEHPVIGFSNKLDADFNPKSECCAILTCSQAVGRCPFIAGAEKRVLTTFEGPKAFDNTLEQAEKYQERSLQIAVEMFYVFSRIQS